MRRTTRLDAFTDDELARAAEAYEYQAGKTKSLQRIAAYQKRALKFRRELLRRLESQGASTGDVFQRIDPRTPARSRGEGGLRVR